MTVAPGPAGMGGARGAGREAGARRQCAGPELTLQALWSPARNVGCGTCGLWRALHLLPAPADRRGCPTAPHPQQRPQALAVSPSFLERRGASCPQGPSLGTSCAERGQLHLLLLSGPGPQARSEGTGWWAELPTPTWAPGVLGALVQCVPLHRPAEPTPLQRHRPPPEIPPVVQAVPHH